MPSAAAYLLLHLILRISSKTCWQCLQDGGSFCLDNNTCIINSTKCQDRVALPINCPSVPAPQFSYDDDFARNTILPITLAVRHPNPQICFDNQVPTMTLYKRRVSNCSSLFSDVTCAGHTAVDHSRKVILLTFRGSHGAHQYYDLYKIGNFNGTVPFLDIGRITKVFSDNFHSIWDSGVGEDLQILINLHPEYEIWVTGYSMGASIALISSAYIAQTGMSSPFNMKVILLGCPRCTDYKFALWHSMHFPYSYHIIHAHDYAPRVPFYDNIDNLALYHPRSEVWYDNDMREGAPFRVCEQADQPFCSSKVGNLSNFDHTHYFHLDIGRWADDGCPRNKEDYRPVPEA